MRDNPALTKSYAFALLIVELYRYLTDERHEFIMSKALLNDGTNVGAYVESAQEAESPAAFQREISIALQKAGRTQFWLNLLHDSKWLDEERYTSANADCGELKRLLGAILRSARNR